MTDALLETIRAYRAGNDEFNRLADADATDERWSEYEAATYGPHLAKLKTWSQPATTRDAALEALRLALDAEGGVAGMEDATDCMIRAAFEYLEKNP